MRTLTSSRNSQTPPGPTIPSSRVVLLMKIDTATMASARTAVASAVLRNTGRQCRRTLPLHTISPRSAVRPAQRSQPCLAIPRYQPFSVSSFRSSFRVYHFDEVKKMSESPTPDRILIGEFDTPFTTHTRKANCLMHARCSRTLRSTSRPHSIRHQRPRQIPPRCLASSRGRV